jgi:hypothetical protein
MQSPAARTHFVEPIWIRVLTRLAATGAGT